MPYAMLTDAQMYYEVVGTGEPVLLLPGMGATCRLIDPIMAPLHDEGFCLIGVDHRGVGQSVARRPVHTLHDYACDLIELLDHLQIDRTHVVGLSLGGIIAQRFAIDHPTRVDRLVLISCAHQFGPYLREMTLLVGNMLRHFSRRNFARALDMLSAGPRYIDADPQRLDRHVADYCSVNASRKDIARQLCALGASDPRPGEYRIVNPTLVIAGEYDRLIPPCYQRDMARVIDQSIFMLIREGGHNPLLECPEALVNVICRYLRTGRAAATDPRFEIEAMHHEKETAA